MLRRQHICFIRGLIDLGRERTSPGLVTGVVAAGTVVLEECRCSLSRHLPTIGSGLVSDLLVIFGRSRLCAERW